VGEDCSLGFLGRKSFIFWGFSSFMLGKLLKRKGAEGGAVVEKRGVQYILWHCPKGTKSRNKVKTYDELPPFDVWVEDIRVYGEEGTYMLQEFIPEGDSGVGTFGRVIWKQEFVMSDEEREERDERRKRRSGLDGLVSFVKQIEEMQSELQKLGDVGLFLARLGGKNVVTLPEGKSIDDFMVEAMDSVRQKWERLDQLFGRSRVRGEDAEIPVDGKIPAWMVYAPQLFEKVLDNVERRMSRWGLVGGKEVEVPEFPKL